ncbi:MAG: hypothetical protein Q6362_005465 [Candidatus Wukongarchaeota archaeon]|nr:hypothetical protein [Candidatus Wukongarchaeota archaeon]
MAVKNNFLTIKKIKGSLPGLTEIDKVKHRNEMILEIFKTKKRIIREEAGK